jgi:hypothetical protein
MSVRRRCPSSIGTMPSRHSSLSERTNRSACGLEFGADAESGLPGHQPLRGTEWQHATSDRDRRSAGDSGRGLRRPRSDAQRLHHERLIWVRRVAASTCRTTSAKSRPTTDARDILLVCPCCKTLTRHATRRACSPFVIVSPPRLISLNKRARSVTSVMGFHMRRLARRTGRFPPLADP